MSTLFYNRPGPVPANEAEVRSTVTVVDNDAPSAVQMHVPDYNDVATDPDTEGGLTTHQLASYVTPSERYLPQPVSAADNDIVDRQVSSSGTAAAREASGQWGHGTLQITEGIEPVIRDGAAFGETYFKVPDRGANDAAGDYMTPASSVDAKTLEDAQATGNDNARDAASPYSAYLSTFKDWN